MKGNPCRKTMGDATPPRQHILCILPFPEPTEIFERIQAKHPNVDFSYRKSSFIGGKFVNHDIPDGTLLLDQFL